MSDGHLSAEKRPSLAERLKNLVEDVARLEFNHGQARHAVNYFRNLIPSLPDGDGWHEHQICGKCHQPWFRMSGSLSWEVLQHSECRLSAPKAPDGVDYLYAGKHLEWQRHDVNPVHARGALRGRFSAA